MADAVSSLCAPLLEGSSDVDPGSLPEVPPQRVRAVVRVVEVASDLDASGGSSSDEPGSGQRRHWGRYASLVPRRSRASWRSRSSVRSRPNVEILAKSREWGQIGDSSSDDELPGVQDRHERYAHLAQEMEAEAKGIKVESSEHDSQGSRWLCFSCCSFCLLQNAINVTLIVQISELWNLAIVCCLAPTAICITFLDICLASTDRSIVHMRCRLRLSRSLLRLLALELFVFIVLGCFHGYWLLQAYRRWMCTDLQGSFLAEVENLNPAGRSSVCRRWDSHFLLWSAPAVVFLTCSLSLGSFALPEAIIGYAVLALAILGAAASVESFDCATSRQVRKWHRVPDQCRWTENCHDEGETRRLRRFHRLARVSEVVGRVLVLFAVSKVIPHCPACAIAILVADYGICVFVLCANSGLTLEVPVVSVVLFLVDIARHVDEPGFALPAQRVSRALDAMRSLEFAFASGVCVAVAIGGFGAPAMSQGVVLIILLAVVWAQCLVLRRLLSLGGHHHDLFTALSQVDLRAMEECLHSEGKYAVDMVVCDGTQQTALHLAAASGHLDCVRFLLEHGAKRNAIDWKMENPLHIAVRKQHWTIARALLQDGNFVDMTTSGKAPKEVLQMVRQMNFKAETPEDLLGKNAAPELAQLLEDVASRAAEADVQSRLGLKPNGSGQSTQSTASSLLHTVSSSLMKNLFGSIVGEEQTNIQVGPREEVRRAELAAFMFFRGMGELLQHLHLYFRGFGRQGRSHGVRVSDLLTLATLGAGSFGKVLKVEDVRSGKLYALKLQCRNKTTKQAVREVQALTAATQHPYIVELIQIFRTGSFYSILMEFCSKDLNRRIIEQESAIGRIEGLPPRVAARYAACVMFALEYLHSRCFVFRDLKPENVLVEEKHDHAKLADFGLARTVAGEVNTDGELIGPRISMAAGTPSFMSSESFDGPPDGERSPSWFAARDWYGLGCCLLLMLLGEGGGRKVYAAKRHVLLPAPGGEILELLIKALDTECIDEDAFDLVSSLTAAQVTERADSKTCRANAFLEEAIRELEPVGLDVKPEA